jgi:ethanolamine utilization microcompartment shell protein EutS
MVELRTFCYLDVLQPQLASFLATVSQGYMPVAGQASLFIEIAPGIQINRITDIALKATGVEPGMQIVERAFGALEIHSHDQGAIRAAGQAVLAYLEAREEDRHKPKVISSEIITGVSDYQTMLVNRMRHGDMILGGESLYIMETLPAGYALLAANEAEKAAPIKLLEVRAFGAFGRLYLGGGESAIQEAAKAAVAVLESTRGKVITGKGGD